MDNATFQRIKDLILKHADVAVVVKPNPNLDEMAAGLGLFQVLLQMGKNAVISCPTDPVVALSSLVGINKVQKQIAAAGESTGDLTVSFPYREGEIEKVSYTLENGALNIVVKAGEKGLSFNQQDVSFNRASSTGKVPSLVFCVGVPHLSEVSSIFTPSSEQEVVNIDNHAENEKYGTTVVVDTKWSSVSEQIADFVTLLEPQIELEKDTAQNLLDGIDFSTNDFTSPRTSYLAFEVAGILMKKGATRQKAQSQAQNVSSQSVASSQTMTQFIPPQPFDAAQGQRPVAQPTYQQPVAPTQPMPQSTYQSPSPMAQAQQQFSQPQPQVQPSWQPPVQQPFGNAQGVPPVQQAQPMPVQQQPSQPMQQPFNQSQGQQVNSGAPKQAPPDWLTPKVYKGSTVL